MKVLMLNGSPRKGGNTSIALAEVEKILGGATEINNLKECDCMFIGEILAQKYYKK